MALINTNLKQIDFTELYMQQMEQSTFKSKSSSDWDKKKQKYEYKCTK